MSDPFIDPVEYVVEIGHYHDGDLLVRIKDVTLDQRSRESVAYALRQAADLVEKGEIRVDS